MDRALSCLYFTSACPERRVNLFIEAATLPGGPLGGCLAAQMLPGLTGNLCPADFDGDSSVDFFDYDGFVVAFEAGC